MGVRIGVYAAGNSPAPSVAVPGLVMMVTVTFTAVSLSFTTHIVNSPSVSLTVTFGRPKLTVTAKDMKIY